MEKITIMNVILILKLEFIILLKNMVLITIFHEILEECEESELNNRERYYRDLYDDVTGKQGLNCRLTKSDDRSGKMSEETRLKMSESRKEMFKRRSFRKRIFFKDKKT